MLNKEIDFFKTLSGLAYCFEAYLTVPIYEAAIGYSVRDYVNGPWVALGWYEKTYPERLAVIREIITLRSLLDIEFSKKEKELLTIKLSEKEFFETLTFICQKFKNHITDCNWYKEKYPERFSILESILNLKFEAVDYFNFWDLKFFQSIFGVPRYRDALDQKELDLFETIFKLCKGIRYGSKENLPTKEALLLEFKFLQEGLIEWSAEKMGIDTKVNVGQIQAVVKELTSIVIPQQYETKAIEDESAWDWYETKFPDRAEVIRTLDA
jgi:hypothetical protein